MQVGPTPYQTSATAVVVAEFYSRTHNAVPPAILLVPTDLSALLSCVTLLPCWELYASCVAKNRTQDIQAGQKRLEEKVAKRQRQHCGW